MKFAGRTRRSAQGRPTQQLLQRFRRNYRERLRDRYLALQRNLVLHRVQQRQLRLVRDQEPRPHAQDRRAPRFGFYRRHVHVRQHRLLCRCAQGGDYQFRSDPRRFVLPERVR